MTDSTPLADMCNAVSETVGGWYSSLRARLSQQSGKPSRMSMLILDEMLTDVSTENGAQLFVYGKKGTKTTPCEWLFTLVPTEEWNASVGEFFGTRKSQFYLFTDLLSVVHRSVFTRDMIRAHRNAELDRYGGESEDFSAMLTNEDVVAVFIFVADYADYLEQTESGEIYLTSPLSKSKSPYCDAHIQYDPVALKADVKLDLIKDAYARSAQQNDCHTKFQHE